MTQRYDQDNILSYVEGELADDQRADFEAILADDHELRQLVSQMKLDRQALRSLGTAPAPVGLIDQVIQAHERSALLGDPAAPEPLPMSANRWKFRRVLAYTSVAAVLLLSFGLVFQTLIPPGLLSNDTQFAHNKTDSNTSQTPIPDVGSGLALLDEDQVYDNIDSHALGRRSSEKESGDSSSPVPASSLALGLDSATDRFESKVAESESLSLAGKSDRAKFERDTSDLPAVALAPKSTIADKEQSLTRTLASANARVDELGESTPAEPSTIGGLLAMTDGSTEADFAERKIDAPVSPGDQVPPVDVFAGYASTIREGRTQLLVNSASPTQARRDLRDWAIGNSARLVVESADESFAAAGIGGSSKNTSGGGGVFSGRRAPALATTPGADFEKSRQVAKPSRYVVVIEEEQLPSLLTYLNRTQSQHAELVTRVHEAVSLEAGDDRGAGALLSMKQARRDAAANTADAEFLEEVNEGTDDQADLPKATANRLVDTHSGWFDSASTVRGLTATPDSNPRRRESQTAKDESTEESNERANRLSKNKEQTPTPPTRLPAPFDWSRLLEPHKPFSSIPPASAPLKQDQPRKKLRLQIIIHQVPDAPGPTIETAQEQPAEVNSKESDQVE